MATEKLSSTKPKSLDRGETFTDRINKIFEENIEDILVVPVVLKDIGYISANGIPSKKSFALNIEPVELYYEMEETGTYLITLSQELWDAIPRNLGLAIYNKNGFSNLKTPSDRMYELTGNAKDSLYQVLKR